MSCSARGVHAWISKDPNRGGWIEWIKTALGNNVIKKLLHQNQNGASDGPILKRITPGKKKKRLNVECFKMIKKRAVIHFDDRNDNLQWFVRPLIFI